MNCIAPVFSDHIHLMTCITQYIIFPALYKSFAGKNRLIQAGVTAPDVQEGCRERRE